MAASMAFLQTLLTVFTRPCAAARAPDLRPLMIARPMLLTVGPMRDPNPEAKRWNPTIRASTTLPTASPTVWELLRMASANPFRNDMATSNAVWIIVGRLSVNACARVCMVLVACAMTSGA